MNRLSQKNIEFLRNTDKLYFVAMKEELDSTLIRTPVIYTGVGKARATKALVRYIFDNYELFKAGKGPVIVSIGTAGSGKFNKGDIIAVDNFSNIGDSCVRFPISFDVFPEHTGNTCASSDYFVGIENFSSPEIESFRNEFECMDMESFALATICSELGVKFCAVKCISDGADKTMSNFDEDLPRFKAVIDEFVKSLE